MRLVHVYNYMGYYVYNLMQHYSDTLTEVELYTIAIDPEIISPITLSADSSCNSNGCYYTFDLNQLNHTESNISVTITATNPVGQSSPAICNGHLIGKMYVLPASYSLSKCVLFLESSGPTCGHCGIFPIACMRDCQDVPL